MAAIGNKVRYIQFNGTLSEWNDRILEGKWYNAIVFGYIYDENKKEALNKIYAGRDTKGVDFIFDFDKSKWRYGDTAKGWHDASSYVTNSVGSITTNMTLDDLMNATDGGDISRILELMLFSLPRPIINLSARAGAISPKSSIDVTFSCTGANSCHMRITDSNGKVLQDSSIGMSANFTLGNLIPNMEYTVYATATKDGESVDSSVVAKTNAAILPIVQLRNIDWVPNTSNNRYRISDISYITSPNDYTVDPSVRYTLNIPGESPKRNLLPELLKLEDLKYNTGYSLVQQYDGTCIYQYPDVSSNPEHFTSASKSLNVQITGTGSVNIVKVNDISINASTAMPIILQNSSVDIKFLMNPRLVLANAGLYKDGVCVEMLSNVSTGTYTMNDILNSSTDNYNLEVKLSDEYGNAYATSNSVSVNYYKPLLFLYNVVTKDSSHYYATYNDYVDVYSILADNGVDEQDPSAGYYLVEQTLNPNYAITGDDEYKGMLLNFLDDAKEMPYVNIKSLTLIDSTTKPGEICYGYEYTQSFSDVMMYALAPAGYKIKFYDDWQGFPNTLLNGIKSTKTITVNGNVYYVWYINNQMQPSIIASQVYWLSIVNE